MVKNIQQFMDFGDEQQQETVQIQENEDVFASTDSGELLRYHYRFGHLSFARLKQMAKEGLIPKKLRNAKVPTCAACQFGKMTKRNWRTRAKGRKIHKATRPGQVVSVDQMESSTKGFIAQMKGLLTKRRYTLLKPTFPLTVSCRHSRLVSVPTHPSPVTFQSLSRSRHCHVPYTLTSLRCQLWRMS